MTWQENAQLDRGLDPGGIGEEHAYARMELLVMGDEVTNYRTYIKIPDDWSRKQDELTISRMVLTIIIPVAFFAGLALTALIIFLKNLRSEESRTIPWRRLSKWAFWALGAYVLIFALGNRIPAFLAAYNTAIPFKVMLGTLSIGAILGGPFYFGIIVVLFGAAWYFAKRAFAEEYFPGWTGMPAKYYRDAFFIGIGGAGALIGIQTLLQVISQHWPTAHRAAAAEFGSNYDAYVPFGAILGTSLLHSMLLYRRSCAGGFVHRVAASRGVVEDAGVCRRDVRADAGELGQPRRLRETVDRGINFAGGDRIRCAIRDAIQYSRMLPRRGVDCTEQRSGGTPEPAESFLQIEWVWIDCCVGFVAGVAGVVVASGWRGFYCDGSALERAATRLESKSESSRGVVFVRASWGAAVLRPYTRRR